MSGSRWSCWFFLQGCGERNDKSRAFPCCTADFYAAAMLADDPIAHRETQTNTTDLALRCEESVKNFVEILFRNPDTGIADRDPDESIVGFRPNPYETSIRHCIARVEDEVEKHLLELVSRPAH